MADIALVASVATLPTVMGNVTSTPINTTGATLLVASTGCYSGAATITDNYGNIWIGLTTHIGSSGHHRIYYSLGAIVGPNHTFTVNGSYCSFIVYAFAGVGSYHSESGAGVNGGSGPLASGTVTPSVDGALIFTGLTANVFAVDAVAPGFGAVTTVPNQAGTSLHSSAAWQVQTTAAPINPTWSWSGGSHQYTSVSTAVFVPGEATSVGPRHVQTTPRVGGLNTTTNITFTTPPKVGNAIIATFLVYGGNFSTATYDISDGYGNPYSTVLKYSTSSTGILMVLCRRVEATGDPFVITITRSEQIYFEACAIEVTDIGTYLSVDKSTTAAGTAVSVSTGTTAALTSPSAFVVSAMAIMSVQSSLYVQTGVTPFWNQAFEKLTYDTIAGEVDYRTVLTGTAQSCAWTASNAANWGAGLVAFRPNTTEPPGFPVNLSQIALEVATLPPSDVAAQLSQAAVEIAWGVDAATVPAQISQVAIEVIYIPGPPRVTQVAVETLSYPESAPARITQNVVEVINQSESSMRTTQNVVEVLIEPTIIEARLSQFTVESLHGHAPSPARLSHVAVETVSASGTAKGRLSHLVVETIAQNIDSDALQEPTGVFMGTILGVVWIE